MNWENIFADVHAGDLSASNAQAETAVIIGNGPSLRDVPLAFLKKYKSFGTNRIYLLDGFTATYYCSVNPLVIQQSADQVNAYPAKAKFIADQEAYRIKDSYPLVSVGAQTFSYNPAAYIYEGFTVTYVCLQLAFHMGFETALLVGVDHRFKMDGPPNAETTWQGDDPNHFSPDYFRGARWNNPDLARSEAAYKMAEKAYRDAGRRIVNLTEGSALDVFEKGKLEEWI